MSFTVYFLKSKISGRLYIGHTQDLAERLYRHNKGLGLATRQECPWVVIHCEKYSTRGKAMQRERYLKSLKNPKYILKHIVRRADP